MLNGDPMPRLLAPIVGMECLSMCRFLTTLRSLQKILTSTHSTLANMCVVLSFFPSFARPALSLFCARSHTLLSVFTPLALSAPPAQLLTVPICVVRFRLPSCNENTYTLDYLSSFARFSPEDSQGSQCINIPCIAQFRIPYQTLPCVRS